MAKVLKRGSRIRIAGEWGGIAEVEIDTIVPESDEPFQVTASSLLLPDGPRDWLIRRTDIYTRPVEQATRKFVVTCEVKDIGAKGGFHLRDFPIEAPTANDAKSAVRDRAYILSLEMRSIVSIKERG